MRNIVRYRASDIKLSEQDKEDLVRLAELPEEQIDLSEIPELDQNFWANAMQNPFYKPKKSSTTIRLDVDVLNWLKSQGKGYQTRINQILRAEMLKAIQSKS